MKGLCIFLTLASMLSFSSAHAQNNYVFTDASEWNGNDAMNVLETQGIRMNAIQNALEKCLQDKNWACALKSSRIKNHNTRKWSNSRGTYRRYTQVEAVFQSIDQLPLEQNGVYTNTDTWKFDSEPSTLKSLGVKAEALDAAIQECHKAGNHFCIVLNVSFLKNNYRFYDSSRGKHRRKTTAQATVRGFKVR